ncbi:GNAT family N-acetyltransferase [Catenuloplanes japonicus]|uniref:GNAT family N-acetyltransferase n=1 Tax=Catenuloplanes japonicus TaxID=33876 RepID=UPI0018DC628A|nr:GNAT family protein [Catenuloplanes japonicus]
MSDEVTLRDVVDADLEALFVQQLDPEAAERARFPSRDRDTFMTHWATRILGDPQVFVQTVSVDGETAGSIVAWWEENRRFLGYWFGRAWWGRGIGTRSLALFLERERTRPIYADPFEGNTASVRLLEKSGFRRDGTVRHGENTHVMLVLD